MSPLVSIIVPIYNAQDYLKQCLDSLINQTYSNLELILVNDGSTDQSEAIIKEYHDKRIKYLKKENTKVGDTRNKGISLATGEYLMFVDSDDYLETTAVQKLVTKAIQDSCDLVIMNMYLETSKQIPLKTKPFKDTSLKDNPSLVTSISLGPCNKLYHKSLFLDKTNRFIVGLKFEDAPVVITSLCLAKKIGLVDECLYHYVIKKTGETITRDERVLDILKICDIILKKIKDYDYLDKTNLIVKILIPYLKNSRYIKDKTLRNKLINEIYLYLNNLDKSWAKASILQEESFLKRIILTHKYLLKIVCNINK